MFGVSFGFELPVERRGYRGADSDAVFSLVFGSLALLASFVMREGELDRNACSRRRPSEVCGYDTFRPGETREV